MAKTDFTKVEEVLADGMRQIEVNRLLNEADQNSNKGGKQGDVSSKINAAQLQRLTNIRQDLKALQAKGIDAYKKLEIDKEEIKKFIKNPETLTTRDWEKIKKIKEKIANLKAELESQANNAQLSSQSFQSAPADKDAIPLTEDDQLVKNERKTQKNKRFNINGKWIPLR